MNDFTYSYPTRIHFGQGAAAKHLPEELANVGRTVMLAYGRESARKNGIYDEMRILLEQAGKDIVDFGGIMPNPTYAKVQEGAALAKAHRVDFILAVGGGSVIDCCKVIAAQAKTEADIWEMEFTEHCFPSTWIPLGAVVTVSGTGSEMNCGAVITNKAQRIKGGVFGAYAEFAVLDPAYTLSVPMQQVFSGAFDTLSHCMETYFGTPRDSNLSDEINEAVMRSVIRNTRALLAAPKDLTARSELLWAAAMGENGLLKIGKVTDFQTHQIEHQLGAYTDCNHGLGLAVLHPVLYRHIYVGAAARFARFAKAVWGIAPDGKTEDALAQAGIQALADFIREIGLPSTLRELGIADAACFPDVAASCNLTAGCCKKLSRQEILEILNECY